jgi:hypothetical protein
MVWRNEIIIAEKPNKAISALLQSILFVGIFLTIWYVTPFLMGFTERLDSHVRGQLLRAIVALCMTPIFLIPVLMIYKSYKIDLFNNELTTSNDILFWTTSRTEKLHGSRTYLILNSPIGIHSNELVVELNNKRITLSKQLHSSEVSELTNFLEQHGFAKKN